MPSYLDNESLEKYLDKTADWILSVREATVALNLTYSASPGVGPPSDNEALASELNDSKEGKIISWKERVVGYSCRHDDCSSCPCLVDNDVYRLLRARKKK